MKYLSSVLANEHNKKLFETALTQKKLSHAYLFAGPEGSGKKTLAEALICEYADVCGDGDQIPSIRSRMCPDIVWATKEDDKKTFGIDPVREAISTVSLSTNALDFKFYIFEEAELLTVQAQNALLKIIEEPPVNTYFILLCSNVASILPTVRSRVQTIYMDVLDDRQILEYLEKSEIRIDDPQRKGFVLRLCNGACGKAVELAQNEDEYGRYCYVCELIHMQSSKNKGATYFDFANKIISKSGDRESLADICDFLILGFRDILAVKAKENANTRFFPKEEALELTDGYADESLELSVASVCKVRNALVYNVNLNSSQTFLAEQLWKSM